jgi:TPR repeat protein
MALIAGNNRSKGVRAMLLSAVRFSFLAILLTLGPPAWSQSGGDLFNSGRQAYERGDYARALAAFNAGASAGNASSINALGVMYSEGKGVPRNDSRARELVRQAANMGHAAAQNAVGGYYYDGEGVARDHVEACNWFRKAATNGDDDGQSNYGDCLWSGQGVAQNRSEAVNWFRKAAQQGHADGQYSMGIAYQSGQGVEFDVRQARAWYGKAAAQKHQASIRMLARMDQLDREIAQEQARDQSSSSSSRPRGDGMSYMRQYEATMKRQAAENCAAAAQGRNRTCVRN